MLYLFLGLDKKKIDAAVDARGGKEAVKIDAFAWDADLVRSLAESNSLFGGGDEAAALEHISENPEAFEEMLPLLSGMAQSQKKFFAIESDMEAEQLEFFENAGAEVVDLREKTFGKQDKTRGNDGYNPFALADAVGSASAKAAWIEYNRARMAGAGPEELHARVWGKVRDMIASEKAGPAELGLHPFVHKKAKADLRNWPQPKLGRFAEALVSIYHDSRLGGEELDPALEKALLSI